MLQSVKKLPYLSLLHGNFSRMVSSWSVLVSSWSFLLHGQSLSLCCMVSVSKSVVGFFLAHSRKKLRKTMDYPVIAIKRYRGRDSVLGNLLLVLF